MVNTDHNTKKDQVGLKHTNTSDASASSGPIQSYEQKPTKKVKTPKKVKPQTWEEGHTDFLP